MTTIETYKESVEQCGSNLRYVPTKFKTYEMCLMAVVENHFNFWVVPNKLLTYDICLIAIKGDVNFINDNNIEFYCMEAIKQYNYPLKFNSDDIVLCLEIYYVQNESFLNFIKEQILKCIISINL